MSTLYVKPVASGTGDGSDWTNAMGASFTPGRGNIYYLADGSYGAKAWSTENSGATLITIKKATVADHGTSTGWSDTLGDGEALFDSWTHDSDYWLMDGQIGGGPGAWDSGFGFRVFSSSAALWTLSGARSSITARHFHLDSDRGVTFIAGLKATTGACSDISISRYAITDVFGPLFHFAGMTGLISSHGYHARNKNTAEDHSEGVSCTGTNTGCVFRWGIWDQIEGTAIFAGVNFGESVGWKIYGNVFARSTSPLYYYWEDPGTNQNDFRDGLILSNTVIDCGGTGVSQGHWVVDKAGSAETNTARNNLFYANDFNSYASGVDHDYTFAADNIRSESGPFDKDSEILSGESNGQDSTGDPFADYDADPLLADLSATTNAGASTGALLLDNSLDMFGASRGGSWMRGAVQDSSFMADSLILNQTANSSPVTELVKRAVVTDGDAGALTEEVIHHSGDYPSQPENGYAYAKHGTGQKHVFVFEGTITLAQALANRP